MSRAHKSSHHRKITSVLVNESHPLSPQILWLLCFDTETLHAFKPPPCFLTEFSDCFHLSNLCTPNSSSVPMTADSSLPIQAAQARTLHPHGAWKKMKCFFSESRRIIPHTRWPFFFLLSLWKQEKVFSRALLEACCESPTQMLELMHKQVLARFHHPASLPALSQQT